MGMTHTGLDRMTCSGLMPSPSTSSSASTVLSSDSILSPAVPSSDIESINSRPYAVIPVESLLSNQYQEPFLYQEPSYADYPEQERGHEDYASTSVYNFSFDLEDYMQEGCRPVAGVPMRGEPEKTLPSLRWQQQQHDQEEEEEEDRRWESVRWQQQESRRFQVEEATSWTGQEEESRTWVQEAEQRYLPPQESRWVREEGEAKTWSQDERAWTEEEGSTWQPDENYLLSCDPGQYVPSEEPPVNCGEVTTSIPLVEQVQSADLASCLSWQEVVGYSRQMSSSPQLPSTLADAGELAARAVLMEERIEGTMGGLVRRILEEKLWRWLHALPCLYILSRAELEATWGRRREALLQASLALALGPGLSSLQDQLDTLGLFLPADTAAFSLSPAVGLPLVQEALPMVLPHGGGRNIHLLGGLPTDRACACLLLLLIFTQQVVEYWYGQGGLWTPVKVIGL